MSALCLCGSAKEAAQCCEPFLEGKAKPESPEALMRSRYVAFCQVKIDYLRETTHPKKREAFDASDNATWAKQAKFKKLDVQRAWQVGDRGEVVFRATFEIEGRTQVHAERSRFVREDGRWYFVDGSTPT
jgi:SEC-C motif-containing protein